MQGFCFPELDGGKEIEELLRIYVIKFQTGRPVPLKKYL